MFLGHAGACNLLVPSRECGNILYTKHIGIIFPYSLLRTRKVIASRGKQNYCTQFRVSSSGFPKAWMAFKAFAGLV